MTDKAKTNPGTSAAFNDLAKRAAPSAAPIVQPGEDAAVLQDAGAPAAMTPDSDMMETLNQPGGLAALQQKVDSTPARNRPLMFRQDETQQHEAAPISLNVPLAGSIESMQRPDHDIEPVNDLLNWKDKAAQLAFLNEFVVVRIHESGDPQAENPVPLGVNGRMVYIQRGEDTIVRRYYAEQLFRARPETITTDVGRTEAGAKNVIHKRRSLKYPFDIVRDDNPRGRAWARQLREQA